MSATGTRWFRGLAVSLGSLVVCALALELLFRLAFGPIQPTNVTEVPRSLWMDSEYQGLRFVLRPNGVAVQEFGSDPRGYFDAGAQLTYRINSLGFRGPELAREKPAGTFRIEALGDSVLFGTGVRDEDTLTAVLERLLVAEGRPCQVLNLACSTYDTYEESLYLRRYGFKLEPDLAFFLFFLNDSVTAGGVITKAFNQTGEKSTLRRLSVLYDHLAARASRAAALETLIASYHRSFEDDAFGWKRVLEGLEKAKEGADKRGLPLVLVIFPLLYQLDASYPFRDVHDKVAATGRELGYHVLDLLPTFLGRKDTDLWVHPTNQHPNEVGHALAARAIHDFLVAEHLVPDAR